MDELRIRSCRAAVAASIDTSAVIAQVAASRAAVEASRVLLRARVFPYEVDFASGGLGTRPRRV